MNLPNIQSSTKRFLFFCIVIFASVLFFVYQSELTIFVSKQQQKISNRTYDQLPMRFEKNMGQADSETSFLFQNQAMALKLSSDKAIIDIRQPIENNSSNQRSITKSITMQFEGANPNAIGEGINKLITKSNYFTGNDPTNWQKDIPNYGKVQFNELYPGIDLVYYGNNGQLEFDFNVSPGKNSEIIELKFEEDNDVQLDENGDLIIKVGNTPVTLKAPIAYQELNEEDIIVEVSYVQYSKTSFGFEVGDYDESFPLIIDPVLVYSTYLLNTCEDITLDNEGNIYLVGGGWRVFITKLVPDGSAEVFTTYLNGDLDDFGLAIAVDNNGFIYVTGETQSDNFPTHNALQEDFGGALWVDGDAFVTKLNPDGSTIVYSTYLGGGSGDIGRDITVDSEGNAYITGSTWGGFPIYNAYQPTHNEVEDVFVTKISPDGSSFIFSTYLGGSNSYGLGRDEGYGIAIDQTNNVYITGSTNSDNFPTVNAYQATYVIGSAFVTKMNSTGTELIYSTYLNGPYNAILGTGATGKSIAVDNAGHAYVAGTTQSPDFPITTNALQQIFAGDFSDLFVTKFSADGSDLIFSTYLGGDGQEGLTGVDIKLDASGNAYITGATNSTNFPTKQAFQPNLSDNLDAFVSVIKSDGLSLLFSSYLGGSGYDYGHGIALRNNGNILVAGYTGSQNFPTISPLNTSGGGFVTEINLGQNEEMLVVKVMQDSLKHNAQPIPNIEMNIYSVDLNKPDDPFVLVETQTTDSEGLLHLPSSSFEPGSPFLIRTKVYSKPAVKEGHEILDNKIYDVYVDNLHIDKQGKIQPARLNNSKNDITVTYLEHPWIGFNIMISIEWQATDNYVDGLKAALLNGDKYLYDITNGQACLQKVAIVDNSVSWDETDIKLRAKNTTWPSSNVANGIVDGLLIEAKKQYVYLPPVFFGSTNKDINNIFNDPINPNTYINYSAIIHELGHYLFGFYDEYKSEDGTLIYPNREGTQPRINFGFMESSGEPMQSEMSAFVSPEYILTAQYQGRSATCWEYFCTKYKVTDTPVRVEFHTPQLLGLSSDEIVEGPLGNELGVGSVIQIIDETGPSGSARQEYIVKDENGEPLPGVLVGVSKPGNRYYIWEGKTVLEGENRGKIKPFTAQIGDRIFFTKSEEQLNWLFLETVVGQNTNQLSKGNNFEAVQEVFLKTVTGQLEFLSEINFSSSGNIEYNLYTKNHFGSLPTIQFYEDGNDGIIYNMAETNFGYNVVIQESIGQSETVCMIQTVDNEGSSFFVPQDLNIIELNEYSNHLVPSLNKVELWLDSESQNLSKLAILGSSFPTPTTGLPDSMMRASNVFAINQHPISEMINANCRIYFDADTLTAANSYAVTIYKWENEWQPMPTDVSLELSYASTKIEEAGFYAAFLDLTQSVLLTSIKEIEKIDDLVPTGFKLYQNYPNPFNPTTTIEYSITDPSKVRLTVYDILGNKVAELVNKSQSSGTYKYTFDGSNLSSGVYIVQLKTSASTGLAADKAGPGTNSYLETRKMILMK